MRCDTLTTKTLAAFQVYVLHEGKRLRFHMQLKDGSFRITDSSVCPAAYLAIEAELSAAVFQSQEAVLAA